MGQRRNMLFLFCFWSFFRTWQFLNGPRSWWLLYQHIMTSIKPTASLQGSKQWEGGVGGGVHSHKILGNNCPEWIFLERYQQLLAGHIYSFLPFTIPSVSIVTCVLLWTNDLIRVYSNSAMILQGQNQKASFVRADWACFGYTTVVMKLVANENSRELKFL